MTKCILVIKNTGSLYGTLSEGSISIYWKRYNEWTSGRLEMKMDGKMLNDV